VTRPRDFSFFVEDDRLRVRFVAASTLGRMESGQGRGGDYGKGVIRLPRYEPRGSLRGSLLHELGHYLYERAELRPSDTTEEDACDLLTWLPMILHDERNGALRRFLGLRLDAPRASR
jgi:hypothetical protein